MVNVKRALQSFFLSLSVTAIQQKLLSSPSPWNIGITFSSVMLFLHCKQNKKGPFVFSSWTGGLSPALWRESGLGAALAVRVRPRGAGVWVWIIVVVVVLCQVFLTYSPVSGAEASHEALVVKTTALLTKWVLSRGSWRGHRNIEVSWVQISSVCCILRAYLQSNLPNTDFWLCAWQITTNSIHNNAVRRQNEAYYSVSACFILCCCSFC